MRAILTHDHTDFDAVASMVGAWKLRPTWVPLLGRFINQNVQAFLTIHGGALPLRRAVDLPPRQQIEQALLVDSQTLPSLRALDPERLTKVEIIDHHQRRPDLPTGWRLRTEPTGACTTLLVEEIRAAALPITWVEATLLLLGIHEDSGSLLYGSTTTRDATAVAWLMAQGARLETVRQHLTHPLNEEQRALYEALLPQAEIWERDGHSILLAWAESETYINDVSSVGTLLRGLYDPHLFLMVVGMGDHVQIVARSRTDAVDVGRLMSRFGGGGHPQAAAAFLDDERAGSVVQQLKSLVNEQVRAEARVGEWMSRGPVRTIGTEMTISEAAAQMKRWGHEGFPVVDRDGAVQGVLVRRDVDRALQHRRGRHPVTEVMHKGDLTVTPEDSIERVRQVMTGASLGQVPVVEGADGTLAGIITRTDLLERSGRSHPGPEAAALLTRLEQAMAPGTLALARRVAEEAAAQGFGAYLVGGLVRDLLLDAPIKDLDIVIEGRAIPVAERLVSQLGGRIVVHQRFGTAKWLLDDPAAPPRGALCVVEDLPSHVDLITARTEFYRRPTALPEIEHASIRQDLHRRDFTINTLALSLDPAREGQLLDFYGGRADLEAGLIRVLHNLSFVEDPTRILRALRFEQRFDFRIEPRSAELLTASLDLLEQVSPDRLRHELFLILQETRADAMLARLDQMGALQILMPQVRWDQSDARRLQRLREAGMDGPADLLAALVWDPELGVARIEQVASRLSLPRAWVARQVALYEVRAAAGTLTAPALPDSELDARLHGQTAESLELLAILTENQPLRARLRHYLDHLRPRRLAIDGRAIRARGLPPGPHYQQLLNRVRAAMLDGTATERAAQESLLDREIEQWQKARNPLSAQDVATPETDHKEDPIP